jgi:hypothetical protein
VGAIGKMKCLFLRHPAPSCATAEKYVNPIRRCCYRGVRASKWACANNISLQTLERGSKDPAGNRAEGGGGGNAISRTRRFVGGLSESSTWVVEALIKIARGGKSEDARLRAMMMCFETPNTNVPRSPALVELAADQVLGGPLNHRTNRLRLGMGKAVWAGCSDWESDSCLVHVGP